MFLRRITYVNTLFLLASAQTTVSTTSSTEADNTTRTEITTTTLETTTAAIVTCSSGEWACADGSCVDVKQECDGVFNCQDGSDENLRNCKGKTREMLGLALHCASPWCDQFAGVCPDICCHQPEYCYYALYARSPSACILPEFPNNGSYRIKVGEKWDGRTEAMMVDFSLKFECVYGTMPVGDDEVHCQKGNWTERFPYCSEACKLNSIPGYQYTCTKKNKTHPCGDYVALGSQVSVEKEGSRRSDAHIYCTFDRAFNTSTGCVPELETLQKAFEDITMGKIDRFESGFSKSDNRSYEFQQLVEEYYEFEKHVQGNTSELNRKTAECGVYLDLLEHERTITESNSTSTTTRSS